MRIGSNPQKKDYKVEINSNHRIIMVVFIPEFTGYYKAMFNVIKLSINSLINTIPKTSKITIVDNGSCLEVQDYLINLLKNESIDSLQLLNQNIGKVDAVIGAARASREPLVTLTDCDILFKQSWVNETIKVFNAFKNVSSVSPIPIRKGFNYYTFSTKKAILKNELILTFNSIKQNFEDYNQFLKSINWEIEKDKSKPWPVIESNNVKAIVGSDHQILTLRRDVLFNYTPKEPSFVKVGNKSEQNYIDLAIDRSGGLRLSTFNYYAMHIGNSTKGVENYLFEIKSSQNDAKISEIKLTPNLKYMEKSKFKYKVIKKLLKYVIKIKTPANY